MECVLPGDEKSIYAIVNDILYYLLLLCSRLRHHRWWYHIIVRSPLQTVSRAFLWSQTIQNSDEEVVEVPLIMQTIALSTRYRETGSDSRSHNFAPSYITECPFQIVGVHIMELPVITKEKKCIPVFVHKMVDGFL